MESLSVLGRLRGRAGLSQRQLAVKADMTEKSISNIETGVTAMPGLPTIYKLAKALEMDFDELYALFAGKPDEVSA